MGENEFLSLYQKILGTQFDNLPAVFQKMHGSPKSTFAEGNVLVEYGTHFLAKLCTPFMPIPPKGNYPLVLEIRRNEKGEEWLRKFPKHSMSSIQYLKKDCFYEQFGWSRFIFDLIGQEKQLIFNCQQQYLGFLPIPRFLMVKPHAIATATSANTWELLVEISFLGVLLAKYKGEMKVINSNNL
jgi:hypothetical protein